VLSMSPARRTEFFKRQFIRSRLPVFARCIIFSLTLVAGKADKFPHDYPSIPFTE
jgi:hypothetical protein